LTSLERATTSARTSASPLSDVSEPETHFDHDVTLENLYDNYHRQAFWVAYQILGDAGDSEDVVQDAFLSAWRYAQTYDGSKGSIKTWLFALVRNRSIDVLRARQRRPICVAEDAANLPAPDHLSIDVDDREAEEPEAEEQAEGLSAIEAIAALPSRQRQVLEMVFLEGLSQTDVAARLSAPVGTIKSRMRLALNRLRLMLVEPGATTGPMLTA